MSSAKHSSKKRSLSPFLIVLLSSFALLALFISLQPAREPIDETILPWNAKFDEQGRLHTLGLVLGETTLREAMERYGKDVEIRLFTDNDGSNKTAEAYFPVLYIGSIKAAMAVRLLAPAAELEAVYNRGAKISPTGSGAKEIKLSSDDNLAFLDKTIVSATLIPGNLTERGIALRFGEPAHKEKQSDGLDHWFFPALGLELLIDPEGPEALQYSMR